MSKIFNINAHKIEPLISPYLLKQELPLSANNLEFVQQSRHQIRRILDGEDQRLLLIVGPCSIHDITAAKDYAIKLRQISDNLSKSFFVIMRAHFEKPRTALGWKGLLHDPHLNGSQDITTGLHLSRELLLFMADLGVPAATEFLDPITSNYLGDLISWACIVARTSESQIHRQCASGLPMPVGFKNSTSGNVDVAVNGILAANCGHSFFGVNELGEISIVQTEGNSHAHIVLRGGESNSNYDADSIAYTIERLKTRHLPQHLVIDCSHDNSSRDYAQQALVFQSVIQQYVQGNTAIKGLSLESNLYAGQQNHSIDKSRLLYGVSITDPCMDWPMTEELLYWGKVILEQSNPVEATKDSAYAQL